MSPLMEALTRQQARLGRTIKLVIMVVNQKGGAGKTTTAVTIAALLAARGWVVRLIDCDRQRGAATEWLLGRELEAEALSLAEFMKDEIDLDDAAIEVRDNLFLIPSDDRLKAIENERPAGAELALRDALAKGGDVITIIDAPPSLGLLTVSGLVAADTLIIPVRASGLDIKGISELNKTLAVVRRRLNPGLHPNAVLVTDAGHNNMTGATVESLKGEYPDAVVMKISHSVVVQEAPTVGETLTEYAPESKPMADYTTAVDHLIPEAKVA